MFNPQLIVLDEKLANALGIRDKTISWNDLWKRIDRLTSPEMRETIIPEPKYPVPQNSER